MNNKQELITEIHEGLRTGIITEDDLKPFIHSPVIAQSPVATPEQPANKPDKLSAVDVMFYIAGIVLYSAIMSIIVQSWEDGNADPTKEISVPQIDANQEFAIKSTEIKSKEANRLLCMRIKPLLVLAILFLMSAILQLLVFVSIMDGSTFTILFVIFGLLQVGMAIYLFFARDHNTASLVLKIILIFSCFSLLGAFTNPASLLISGSMVIFIWYVYKRVSNLDYY